MLPSERLLLLLWSPAASEKHNSQIICPKIGICVLIRSNVSCLCITGNSGKEFLSIDDLSIYYSYAGKIDIKNS